MLGVFLLLGISLTAGYYAAAIHDVPRRGAATQQRYHIPVQSYFSKPSLRQLSNLAPPGHRTFLAAGRVYPLSWKTFRFCGSMEFCYSSRQAGRTMEVHVLGNGTASLTFYMLLDKWSWPCVTSHIILPPVGSTRSFIILPVVPFFSAAAGSSSRRVVCLFPSHQVHLGHAP